MSEAQRRAQRAYVERALDLLEDTSLSEEELERRIPAVDLGLIPVDALIDAFRRRIARWQHPAAARSRQDSERAYDSYIRLQRLAGALANQAAEAARTVERSLD
jgi:hypothetical protein